MPALVVIGAGWGRTGTDSLRFALNELGFGPTLHMKEIYKGGFFSPWLAIGQAATPTERRALIKRFFESTEYRSSVGVPSSTFYKDLMAVYPDAKVILTIRDSPEAWYKSEDDTILLMTRDSATLSRATFSHGFVFGLGMWLGHKLIMKRETFPMHSKTWHWAVGSTKAESLVKYEAWIDDVKRVVPANKLLVYNVKDGWDPLVGFLGVPKPSTPFPRVNDTAEFQRLMRTFAFMGYVLASLVGAVVVGGVWAVARFGPSVWSGA